MSSKNDAQYEHDKSRFRKSLSTPLSKAIESRDLEKTLKAILDSDPEPETEDFPIIVETKED